jgi:hypothetical protein
MAAAIAACESQPCLENVWRMLQTFPCTTACSPYTMTFPGAETMKGGIMGDDCFLCSAGAPFFSVVATSGSCEANWGGIVSMGEASGVCVPCDDVVCGGRRNAVPLSAMARGLVFARCDSPGGSLVFLRMLPFVAIPVLGERIPRGESSEKRGQEALDRV